MGVLLSLSFTGKVSKEHLCPDHLLARGGEVGPYWYTRFFRVCLFHLEFPPRCWQLSEIHRETSFSHPQTHWVRKNDGQIPQMGRVDSRTMGLQTWVVFMNPYWDLLECKFLIYTPGDSDAVNWGWGPGICICKHPRQFWGWITLWETLLWNWLWGGRNHHGTWWLGTPSESHLGLHFACSWNTLKKTE